MLHINNCIYTVYTKLMRNVSNYIIQIHFYVLHAWSRLGELPSSDEMKMFYAEHDFQVDLENLRVQLEISCRENVAMDCKFLIHLSVSENNVLIYSKIDINTTNKLRKLSPMFIY